MNKIYQIWVKKYIAKTEWNTRFSNIDTYCFLRKDDNGVWAGFLTGDPNPDFIPEGCFKMTNEELFQVDGSRRSKNIRPFPLGEVERPKTIKVKKSVIDILNKMKAKFLGKTSTKTEIPNMPTPFFEPLEAIKKDAIEEEKRDIAEERQKKLDDIPF